MKSNLKNNFKVLLDSFASPIKLCKAGSRIDPLQTPFVPHEANDLLLPPDVPLPGALDVVCHVFACSLNKTHQPRLDLIHESVIVPHKYLVVGLQVFQKSFELVAILSYFISYLLVLSHCEMYLRQFPFQCPYK
jgi:hypothetical protein